jgi:anti-sigma regulatory factor (Ser/Thr protein kinase)
MTMNGEPRFSLSFKPCFDRVDDVRGAIREACADHLRLPENDPNIMDFCQAVTELLNNAVEHSGACSIRADLQCSGRAAAFILTTDGPPFDPTGKAELPEPDASGDLPEGGYGLAIIQRLVDAMEHEYRDGHNRVILKKSFPTGNGEGADDGNQT